MFSGIVLVGEKSKRMGMDKRHVMLSGVCLLELSVNRLRVLIEDVLVITGEREFRYSGCPFCFRS